MDDPRSKKIEDESSNDVFIDKNETPSIVTIKNIKRIGYSSSSTSSSSSSTSSYKRTMSSTSSNDHKQNSSAIYCRICHEDELSEELIDPCECAGSVGQVHTSCLEKWLSTSNTDRCEICKHKFTIERKKKSVNQSFKEWWHSKNVNGPRGVTGDVICLAILTPLCLAATYLCAIGATAYSRLGYWEGAGLAVLCSLLVGTYCLWFLITLRYHYKTWRRWRKQNQDVVLLIKHKNDDEKLFDNKRGIRVDDLGLIKNSERSSAVRQGININHQSGLNTSRFIFGLTFSHEQDPTYTVHQQTSFV